MAAFLNLVSAPPAGAIQGEKLLHSNLWLQIRLNPEDILSLVDTTLREGKQGTRIELRDGRVLYVTASVHQVVGQM